MKSEKIKKREMVSLIHNLRCLRKPRQQRQRERH